MRNLKLWLVLISAFILTSFTQDNHLKEKGIVFFKGTWDEALKKAKAERKYIFLDVYASWCGPCKQLKRKTFKDSEVSEYYNKNFVNVSLDAESGEGIDIAAYYQVTSYPTLFIIDSNGKKMTRATGFLEPHILVNFGRRIVP